METRFRTQVFGFLDILGESWNIYKLGIKNFLLIALAVYLPYSIFLYFYPTGNDLAKVLGDNSAPISLLFTLVQIGIFLIIYVAVAYLVEEIVQGRTTSWTYALAYSLSRLPIVFVIYLLFSILLGISTLLLIIPGIIIGTYLVFTLFIVALRKIGFKAFQYSIGLVKGQWWRVFGIWLGIVFIASAFNFLLFWVIRLSAPYIGIGAILIQFIGYLVTLLLPICLVVFFSQPGLPQASA